MALHDYWYRVERNECSACSRDAGVSTTLLAAAMIAATKKLPKGDFQPPG